MALCRVVCDAPYEGDYSTNGRCTFAATVVRNPPTACPRCRAPLQPIWDPPSLETGNRKARRALKAMARKRVSVDTPDTPHDTSQDR